MSEPYIGEIRMFGGTFAPCGWAFCNGQLLSIAENTALYSLLGTTYGGDGQNTFALPDLRGRAPVHIGSTYPQGTSIGVENVTLTTTQMPTHSHPALALSSAGSSATPGGNYWAASSKSDNQYTNTLSAPNPMNAAATTISGGSQPHDNMQPYLVISFIIALEGIYPPRN